MQNVTRSRSVQNWTNRIDAQGGVASELIEEATKNMNKLEQGNIHVDIGYPLLNLAYMLNQRFGLPRRNPVNSYAKACNIIREEIPEQVKDYDILYGQELTRSLKSPEGLNIIIQLNEDIKNSSKKYVQHRFRG